MSHDGLTRGHCPVFLRARCSVRLAHDLRDRVQNQHTGSGLANSCERQHNGIRKRRKPVCSVFEVGHVAEEAGQIGKAEDLKAVLHLMGGTPDKPPARDVVMDD